MGTAIVLPKGPWALNPRPGLGCHALLNTHAPVQPWQLPSTCDLQWIAENSSADIQTSWTGNCAADCRLKKTKTFLLTWQKSASKNKKMSTGKRLAKRSILGTRVAAPISDGLYMTGIIQVGKFYFCQFFFTFCQFGSIEGHFFGPKSCQIKFFLVANRHKLVTT